mmetsp:Transcript_28826/g.87184  ORF Transcript_28826/g.87184 Transcript_28826/m.87184 type:complete len:223 (+) Transcript_28826:2838-3506(+)
MSDSSSCKRSMCLLSLSSLSASSAAAALLFGPLQLSERCSAKRACSARRGSSSRPHSRAAWTCARRLRSAWASGGFAWAASSFELLSPMRRPASAMSSASFGSSHCSPAAWIRATISRSAVPSPDARQPWSSWCRSVSRFKAVQRSRSLSTASHWRPAEPARTSISWMACKSVPPKCSSTCVARASRSSFCLWRSSSSSRRRSAAFFITAAPDGCVHLLGSW